MIGRLWLAVPVAVALFGGTAAAEQYTLKLRDLAYHADSRSCRAKFYMESLDGDLPVGFTVTYDSDQDGEIIQRCTYTKMEYRDPEWSCEHGFLTDCEGIGVLDVEATSCLDNLRNPVACTVKIGSPDMLVDKRKH